MSTPTRPVPHGTLGGYTNHRCRCEECQRANRDYMRDWLRTARSSPTPPWAQHGSYITYNNYGCRCGPCCDARLAYDRQRRAS